MTEALREEMLIAGHPVGVTAVHPGGIKTAIARNARVSANEDQAATAQLFDEKLAKMTPERAAEIIVKGILGNKARVLVGLDAHALHHLAKLHRLALPGRRRPARARRSLPPRPRRLTRLSGSLPARPTCRADCVERRGDPAAPVTPSASR